jgi:uncharacterized protein (DUF1800 family)
MQKYFRRKAAREFTDRHISAMLVVYRYGGSDGMTARDAFIAVNRFGLGARPGELAAAAGDPRGWVERQLAASPSMPKQLAGLRPSRDAVVELMEFQRQDKTEKDPARKKALRAKMREAFIAEAGARTAAQIGSQTPVIERLVVFWSNHFTVSARKPLLVGTVGAFEREAIRPHVTGQFAQMLRAVLRHPAMLAYLDNVQSIGPNSKAGKRRERGLNENLAREALELHTLSVDGGYTQADVRAFAKMLTGWSIGGPKSADFGRFDFHERAHEPGPKTLLGRRYEEAGVKEAEAALAVLARHPATAKHIAFKMARHFVADQPPPALVRTLTKTFLDTDGDLRAMTTALLHAPDTWAEPLAKVKTPNEFVVSTLRATGFADEPKKLVASLRLLGQMPFSAPSPAGWPDEGAKWVSAQALLQRAEFAMAVARRAGDAVSADALLAESIGPVVSSATRSALRRAPTRAEALATLFACPEFQRR